jgi:hypothetical protein
MQQLTARSGWKWPRLSPVLGGGHALNLSGSSA